MKTFSHRQLAIYIALSASIISAIFQIFSIYIENTESFKYTIISGLSIFLIIYVATYYIFKYFIINKIKPIYKTIRPVSVTDNELNDTLEEKDIINIVNKEVNEWVENRSIEISQLKKMEKYRKEFLGNVSHELKTPIFNIQGYVLTLLDGGLDDQNINRVYLERTEKSINRLISIVEDLEEISKLESGELDLKFAEFDIVQLISEIFEMYEIKAKEKHISFNINRPSENKIYVKADKEQILHLISNLIDNSIKYGKPGGKTEIDFFDMDKNILIEVTDNGIGIDKKDIPRLFERFYRVDKSRSSQQGGTGLGLSIVKHIVEAHDQTINVRSKPGEGTSFAFTLKKAKR